jgi:sugar/nucleoside kinase (ribokinase family)
MTPRILVIGDIITDVVAVHSGPLASDSDTPAGITTTGGGSGANTAAWLAHLGEAVELLGVVGVDPAGEDRLAELTEAGVGSSCLVWSRTAPTGTIIVLTDGTHRTFVTDRGANHELQPSHVDEALTALPGLTHVHLSGYTLLDESSRPAGRRALAVAAERGLSTSVDAASVEPLRQVGPDQFLAWVAGTDLLLANLDEARMLTASVDGSAPEQVAAALARSVPEVVVKLGPGGAVWARGGEIRTVPAVSAEVADTTGAGDAFAAGLLAARLAGADVDTSLAAAVRLGAVAVGLIGGRPPAVVAHDAPDRLGQGTEERL